MAKKKEENENSDALSDIVANAEIDIDTVGGDCRDIMLDIIKHRPKPWDAMDEAEKLDVVKAIEFAVREMVSKAVDVLADSEKIGIKGLLETYSEKDGFKVTVKVRGSDNEEMGDQAVLILHKSQGKLVKIIPCSAEDYLGEREGVDIPSDEPEIDFEGSTEEGGSDTEEQEAE